MKSNYKSIGEHIRLVDVRNAGLKVTTLLGLSISKEFISSVANTVGSDMENYKIIRKNQFACSLMQVRRDKKIPVALLQQFDKAIISQAYPVFEVIDEEVLLPEYLMMWFSRAEFDREACFYAVGGVRGSLEWEDFCNMQLPIPNIDKQKEIVAEYNTIVNRIKLNEQLIQKLEETAQAIYKQWFVDFEFPNRKGNPYKSSDGEMFWEEEIELEIPKGWRNKKLSQVARISAGGDKPKAFSRNETDEFNVPIFSNSTIDGGIFGYTNEARVTEESITISARGGIGFTMLRHNPFFPIVRLLVVTPHNHYLLNYLYESIRRFRYDDVASAQGQLTVPEFSSYKVIMPDSQLLLNFQEIMDVLTRCIDINKCQIRKMKMLRELILSKITKAFV